MAAEVKAEKPRLQLKWLQRLTADLDDDEDSSDATPQSTPQKPTRAREEAPALQAEASGEEDKATSKKEEPPQQKEEDGGRVVGNANKSNHVEKKVRRKRPREEEKDVDADKPSHKKVKGGKRQLVVVAGKKRRNSGVEIADGERGHRQRLLDKGEVAQRSRPRGSPLPTRDVQNALSETQELSVDSAKSKAADFRQQRMRKLHARRLATGEHDRLSAVKLKREAKKGKQKRGKVVKMPTVENKEKEEMGEKMSTVKREEKVATLEMEEKKEREEKLATVEKAEKMATLKKEKIASAKKAEKMATVGKEKMVSAEKEEKMAMEKEEKMTTVEKEGKMATVKKEKMATVKKEKMAMVEKPEKMASVEQEMKMATGVKPEKMATVEKKEKTTTVEKEEKIATVEKEEKMASLEMEEKEASLEMEKKEETQKMETVEKEKEDMLKIETMENVEKENIVDHASALRAAGFKDVAVSDEPVEGKHEPSPPPLSRSDAADSTVDHDPDLEAVSETGNKAGEIESNVEETTKQDILLDMMPIPRKSSAEKVEAAPSAVEFVIPKRSVKTSVGSTESILGAKAMRAGSLGDAKTLSSSIPVTIKPVPSPSPKPSPTFSRHPPVQIQRKRTKNHVPVKKSTVAPQDRALMRLARKRNSIFVAAAELAALGHSDTTSAKKAPVRMTGYEVFDIDGKTLPDLIPRLSCPTKREMASNRDAYPAVFFGVSLSVPEAKGGSSPAPDDSESGECDERRMSCYEELRFERPEDREFYQQRMYGTTFVPQRLRGWTTLIVRNARFERKSTGIRFNQDRDRDEFAAMLSKRYTFKKSVPRCDIPRENWQKLMRNQPGAVYLHYYNREDAEQASLFFRDELGNPLELRLEYRAGVVINRSSTPATRSASQNRSRRSGSAEQFAPESSPLSSQGGSARSTPSWRRERQRTPRGDYRQSVLKGSVVSTLPRDQEIIEGGKGREEGELGNSTTTDTIATDRREKIQRSRSPLQRQHVRNMQAPQQHRESYPAGLHERSRGNRGFDRKRSRSRSRPRGSRGEDWGTKEGRRPRNFSPGDRSNTGPRRPVYPDDMNRYGGRGYQKEGHRGRMGGSNSRPH